MKKILITILNFIFLSLSFTNPIYSHYRQNNYVDEYYDFLMRYLNTGSRYNEMYVADEGLFAIFIDFNNDKIPELVTIDSSEQINNHRTGTSYVEIYSYENSQVKKMKYSDGEDCLQVYREHMLPDYEIGKDRSTGNSKLFISSSQGGTGEGSNYIDILSLDSSKINILNYENSYYRSYDEDEQGWVYSYGYSIDGIDLSEQENQKSYDNLISNLEMLNVTPTALSKESISKWRHDNLNKVETKERVDLFGYEEVTDKNIIQDLEVMLSDIGGMKSFDVNSLDISNIIPYFLHRATYMKSHGISIDDIIEDFREVDLKSYGRNDSSHEFMASSTLDKLTRFYFGKTFDYKTIDYENDGYKETLVFKDGGYYFTGLTITIWHDVKNSKVYQKDNQYIIDADLYIEGDYSSDYSNRVFGVFEKTDNGFKVIQYRNNMLTDGIYSLNKDGIFLDLNGEPISSHIMPYISSDTIMYPLGIILDSLNESAEFEVNENSIKFSVKDKNIVLKNNSNIVNINGEKLALNAAVELKRNEILVPIDLISTLYDIKVQEYPYINTVNLVITKMNDEIVENTRDKEITKNISDLKMTSIYQNNPLAYVGFFIILSVIIALVSLLALKKISRKTFMSSMIALLMISTIIFFIRNEDSRKSKFNNENNDIYIEEDSNAEEKNNNESLSSENIIESSNDDSIYKKPEIIPENILKWDSAVSSSTLTDNYGTYFPEYVIDNNLVTTWAEASKESSINEWIKVQANDERVVSAIEIYNGYYKNEKTFLNNNRVKTMELEFSNGESKIINLSDDFSKPNLIYLDEPVKTNYIKFKILEIYSGERFDDTCISEINVY